MIDLILKIASENSDGFTIRLEDLKHVTRGIAVAYAETQNSFGNEGLIKVINHAKQNGKTVGGWLDYESELYYFDSVKIFPNHMMKEAIEFAVENKQIAVFDITNGQEIRL